MKKARVEFRINTTILDDLDFYAKQKDFSRSEYIRYLIMNDIIYNIRKEKNK